MAKHDDKIKELLSKVEAQQKALGTKPRVSYKANGMFKYGPGAAFFNLNTVQDSQVLVEALAFLLEKDSTHADAAKRLGVPVKTFSHDGFPVSDWEGDFKQRVEQIAYDERKRKLDATKATLKSVMSEDLRTEETLSGIEDLLK